MQNLVLNIGPLAGQQFERRECGGAMGSAAGSCVVALWLVAAGVPVVRATADQVLIIEHYT